MGASIHYQIVLVLLVLGFIPILYVMAGGKKLWGPHRGTPFCGHPFELTWAMDPTPEEWTCPKCATTFEPRDGKWMPKR